MSNFITPEEAMKKQQEGAHLIFLDCRFKRTDPDFGIKIYAEEHIPGAFHTDLSKDLSEHGGRHGGDHPMLESEDFKKLLESYGATDDSLIIAYDDGNLSAPARVVFQGRYSGVKNIRILEGGLAAWKAAGGKTESGVREPVGGGQISVQTDESLLVDMAHVKANKDREDTLLVDCRQAIRYRGEKEPVYSKAGHIPGAKSCFSGDLVENGQLKDKAFLEEHLKDFRNYDEVITSCGSGGFSCILNLALEELGIDHVMYNGGFSEWITDPNNDVAVGEE